MKKFWFAIESKHNHNAFYLHVAYSNELHCLQLPYVFLIRVISPSFVNGQLQSNVLWPERDIIIFIFLSLDRQTCKCGSRVVAKILTDSGIP